MARCQNIGNFSAEKAIAYGLSGPLLRASGVPVGPAQGRAVLHLRPLQLRDPGRPLRRRLRPLSRPARGDAPVHQDHRAGARADAARRPDRAREDAAPPPHAARRGVLRKVESPRGEWGVYLVSKGGDKPYRLKMRSPSFCNLSALREMTVGQYLADAVMILGSMDIVLCDVDR